MMTVKMHLTHLFSLLALLTGVCPQALEEIYVKAGEMVALQCPHYRGHNHGDANLTWTSYTTQEMDLTNSMSSAEQMGVLVHDRSLVILRASVNHQGNYSCSLGSASRQHWFKLTVYKTLSKEYEEKTQYDMTCFTHKSCKLYCPNVNTPASNIPNMTSNGVTWHKEVTPESLPENSYYSSNVKDKTYYFSSVEEKDRGAYTCTRSYLYLDQIYNMSFTVVLDVQTNNKINRKAVIISPRESDVFHVDLGSAVVIDCTAVVYSPFDGVFWLSGNSFVEKNNSLSVFYNFTRKTCTKEMKMTASLIFKSVSEEDLAKHYTCKLESASQLSKFVTITLAQKDRPSSLSLAFGIVGIVVAIVFTVVCYVKLKSNLQDTLGCYRSTSGGSHDLVHYQRPHDV